MKPPVPEIVVDGADPEDDGCSFVVDAVGPWEGATRQALADAAERGDPGPTSR